MVTKSEEKYIFELAQGEMNFAELGRTKSKELVDWRSFDSV